MIIQFVVAAGKKEQGRSWAEIGDVSTGRGAVTAHGEGTPPDEPDVTFTATPADAQALHDGSLELSVGFMRGQVKMAGDFGAVLQFLPLTHGPSPQVPVPDLLP